MSRDIADKLRAEITEWEDELAQAIHAGWAKGEAEFGDDKSVSVHLIRETRALIANLTAERDALATEVTTLQQVIRDQSKYAGMNGKATEALVQSLREALEPFAAFADGIPHFTGPSRPGTYAYESSVVGSRLITDEDFARAKSALSPQAKP